MKQWYYGGAPYHPGTNFPNNVTGECSHQHRTPGGAQRCIADYDRSIKRGHGPAAYCDRVVMFHDNATGVTRPWSTD